ncbi:MAG: hypothetical protein KC561_15290, partial [Myxococcales bacterium]|nr:hypothetical protein [Myxococcales bacterium]
MRSSSFAWGLVCAAVVLAGCSGGSNGPISDATDDTSSNSTTSPLFNPNNNTNSNDQRQGVGPFSGGSGELAQDDGSDGGGFTGNGPPANQSECATLCTTIDTCGFMDDMEIDQAGCIQACMADVSSQDVATASGMNCSQLGDAIFDEGGASGQERCSDACDFIESCGFLTDNGQGFDHGDCVDACLQYGTSEDLDAIESASCSDVAIDQDDIADANVGSGCINACGKLVSCDFLSDSDEEYCIDECFAWATQDEINFVMNSSCSDISDALEGGSDDECGLDEVCDDSCEFDPDCEICVGEGCS